jgi:ABC-type glycerol-3-phosphate transport system permease component
MSRREKNLWIVAGIAIVLARVFPIAWIVSLSFKAASDISNASSCDVGDRRTTRRSHRVGQWLFLPALGTRSASA